MGVSRRFRPLGPVFGPRDHQKRTQDEKLTLGNLLGSATAPGETVHLELDRDIVGLLGDKLELDVLADV